MTATPPDLPMDREAVLDRMAKARRRILAEVYDRYVGAYDEERALSAALSASGLLERIAELEAETKRKDAALRLTARWFALAADDLGDSLRAESESVVAEIGKALAQPQVKDPE